MRTLACGAGLGGALLLGLGLVGGIEERGSDAPTPFTDRPGPATALQPQLRDALLTGEDLPPAPEPSRAAIEPAAPAHDAPVPSARDRTGSPETGAIAELCRIIFDAPDGLSELWPTPPAESTSRYIEQLDGGSLHQALGVFDGERSVEAYRTLRESATGCDRFQTTLSGDAPVTVLLRELTRDRRESGTADDGYTMLILLEDGTPAGWLSVDRIGPVVSVLRHLGPIGDHDDIAETRKAALDKLQPLLRALRDRTLHHLRG